MYIITYEDYCEGSSDEFMSGIHKVFEDEEDAKKCLQLCLEQELEYMKDTYEEDEECIETKKHETSFTLDLGYRCITYKIEEYELEDIRRCSECKNIMNQGYCIENGLEYYCSDECLHKHYTKEEYNLMYNSGDSYYTSWED